MIISTISPSLDGYKKSKTLNSKTYNRQRSSLMASFSNIKAVNRMKFKIYNEKSLILLLLLLSVITVFIILMNLPSDIQRTSRKELEEVFIPKVDGRVRHEEYHQHVAPPIYRDNESNNKRNEEPTENKNLDINQIDSIEAKREKIKQMALFGWKNYEKYAWGENELKPLSKMGHSAGIFGSVATKLGATIVDGLDTMYMMGYLEEYKRGREWIINSFNIDVVNIRFIGGFLSLYTLTNDKIFLDKAEMVAQKLMPAFETETGIPFAIINPITKKKKNYNWAIGSCSILAEFGTLSLEFQYLSDLTGNPLYAQKIEKIFETLNKVEKDTGLYYNYMNQHSGKWCMKHAGMGALADSFYEYLLKLWLYKNKSDRALIKIYMDAMKSVEKHLMETTPKTNLTYFGEFKSNRLDKKMDHLSCFTGGLLGLTSTQVDLLTPIEKEHYFSLAERITHTCHESYVRTATHLGPEAFHFERESQEAKSVKNEEKYYILRPEVIESYFYMWRFTRDEKYRDWAWDAAQALEKHCRTEHGYSGIKDVYGTRPSLDDVQQTFLFAETFKYLYLIFSDDHVLPLDKFVLNTEAHLILINKKKY